MKWGTILMGLVKGNNDIDLVGMAKGNNDIFLVGIMKGTVVIRTVYGIGKRK